MSDVPEFTSTKSFYNFPCAHRQHKHEGNCHLIHGYSRSFHLVFGAQTMTKEGTIYTDSIGNRRKGYTTTATAKSTATATKATNSKTTATGLSFH